MTQETEPTPEFFAAWRKCAVPACTNKCCLALNSRYCWPHTPGDAQIAALNLVETELETCYDPRD